MASSRAQTRRARISARSSALSGAGPTSAAAEKSRWPGAASRFALFGEVLATGIIVIVASLPLITLPLALAVGHRHLLRFLRAEDSSLRLAWADFRAGLFGGIAVGFAFLLIVGILLLDLHMVSTGLLPGGTLVGVIAAAGVVAVVVLTLQAAAVWSPATGWRSALKAAPSRVRADVVGSIYLAVAAGLTVLFTWMLIPLIVPTLGCLCFASATIAARRLDPAES